MCNRFDLYYWCEHLSYMNDSFIPWKICSCSPNPKFPYSLYPPNRQIMRIMAWAYGWRMPIFFTFVDCGKKRKSKRQKIWILVFLGKNKLALFCTIGTFFLHLHSFDYQPEISPPTFHQEKYMLKNILLFQYWKKTLQFKTRYFSSLMQKEIQLWIQ